MVLAVALQDASSHRPCGSPRRMQLLPVDQAAMQPDFFTFRARLLTAIARRDEAALVAAVDPDIRLSFGTDNGIDDFRKMLRDPKGTFWADLAAALSLGGTFMSPDTFVAPYVFATWPDGADSFECAAILGERVSVRKTAVRGSAVLASVSFDVVQVLRDRRDGTPVQVRLANGVTGFVAPAFVRSPIDRRASFEKSGGQWRLRSFVIGD